MKDTSTLVEYVQLLIEKKIREADISDGQKAKWGSRKHISDLKRRLKEAEYWRDKQKKGSEKRAHYRNVVNDIKRQLAAASRKPEKQELEESIEHIIELLTENEEKEQESVANDYSNPEEKRPGIVVSSEDVKWNKWPSTPVSFDYKVPGTGRGEATLAWLMNGVVMGQNATKDVLGMSDGSYAEKNPEMWEVKEPDESSIVRLGGPTSAKAIADVIFEMIEVVNMIDDFVKDKSEGVLAFKSSIKQDDMSILQNFSEKESEKFKAGNVPKNRYNKLLNCIAAIKRSLGGEFSPSPNEKAGNKYVVFGDRERSATIKKDITLKMYKRLGTLAGIPDAELEITPTEKLAQRFDHEAFTNTSAWAEKNDLWGNRELFEKIVNSSMKGITGMIFVNSSGYCAITSGEVINVLRFESVTSNRIKFRVIIGQSKVET